jgi:hypothetical protein
VAELPGGGQTGEPSEGAVAPVEASEVIEHLETLDERILAALAKRRKAAEAQPASAEAEAPGEPSAKPPRSLWVQGDAAQP